MRCIRVLARLASALVLSLSPGSALAQAGGAVAEQSAVAAEDAVATFAEFLHIDAAQVESVRPFHPVAPDTQFAGIVRHRPPSDARWFGPRDARGMVECRVEIGRMRGTAQLYVRRASWATGPRVGAHTIGLDDVPALARRFLEVYCPFPTADLTMEYCEGFPAGESDCGTTGWSRCAPTESLQIDVAVWLSDGSVSYSCWYRTGLTPAAVTEEQAKQIAEEQWRAKYPEQELVYEEASKLLESEFSPTKGPVWMVTYRRGPEGGRPGEEGGTEHVWLTIDAVTGAITKAPNFTPPKLTREEAKRICDEQWLAKWPDEKLEHDMLGLGLDSQVSPSHGPVWFFSIRRLGEGVLPLSGGRRDAEVYVDALTGEILRAPNLTRPRLSETDAEQVVQGEWVSKHPGEKLGLRSAKALLDSPKSPSHGPVWVFTYSHGWRQTPTTAPLVRDVDVTIDALTGEILEVPDLTTKEPKSMKP